MTRHKTLPLSNSDRRELLARARQAIVEAVVHHRVPDLPPLAGRLAEPRGAFVSLLCRGRLRGCIGRTQPNQPLGETVTQCAISAALNDLRFAAIEANEIGDLSIEISVLNEPALLPRQTVESQAIEIGRHGLLVVRGGKRALLLPQVAAERHWSAERFLEEACRKAGLAPGAWRDGQTQLFGFTVEAFSETEPQQV